MSKPTILAHPGLGAFTGLFGAHFEVDRLPPEGAERDAWFPGPGREVSAAVAIGSIGLPQECYALPNLKLIACFGAGYDAIDLAAARAAGIAVTNCPSLNHEDVADVALGLLISAARNIAAGDRLVRAGGWRGPLAFPPPRRLRGRKLGVVGFGAIGQALAERAQALGLEIAWWGPRAKPEAAYPRMESLMALASWADFLVLAPRVTPETDRMIDRAVLDALGPEGVLINVSRGSVVDEDALLEALREGRIAGAGLDVYAEEPTPAERWADLANVTVTPHLAGATRESILESAQLVFENLRRHFAGEPLATPVALDD